MQQPETAVSAECAYQAAVGRALRTTEALILAEAQIVELHGQLNLRAEENGRLRQRLDEYSKDREPEEPGEVDGDGASTDNGSADEVSEAVPTGAFSD